MQEEQKKLIRRYLGSLVEINDVPSLAKLLVDKKIFTEAERSEVFFPVNQPQNNRDFFQKLQEKDGKTFKILVEWLIQVGQDRLARKLAAQSSGITPFAGSVDDEETDEEDEITSSIEADLVELTLTESTKPLEVLVKVATEFRDTKFHNPNTSYYKCRSFKRGRVLIINNYEFPGSDHRTRTGAKVDEENLKQLFHQMGGWVVKIKNNLTAAQMKEVLQSFAKPKREKISDICFIFVMSHGSEQANETIIYGSDNRHLSASQIQGYFTNDRCPLFRGKPKVFIYQVCRGNDIDVSSKSFNTHTDGKQHKSQPSPIEEQQQMQQHFRPVDDMLIGYATMQGSKAHRDLYRGTWYIELICKHFMNLAKEEPVDNLLLIVDNDLRNMVSEMGTVQTAEFISKGFKKLYLNPGIYEDNGRLKHFNEEEG